MHCVLFVFTDEERWVRTERERSAIWWNVRPCHGYTKLFACVTLRWGAVVAETRLQRSTMWSTEFVAVRICRWCTGSSSAAPLNIWASGALNAVLYTSWRCAVQSLQCCCYAEHFCLMRLQNISCSVLEIVIFDCTESLICVDRSQISESAHVVHYWLLWEIQHNLCWDLLISCLLPCCMSDIHELWQNGVS